MCYNNQIKKSCYLIAFAVVMLSACQKDNLTEFSDMTAERPAIQQTLSKEDAVAQAIGFVSDMKTTASTRSVLNKEVSSVYAWRSSEIYGERMAMQSSQSLLDTMLYIVNFGNEEGYALVSADADNQGVVAYIERGSLTPNDSIDNPGFKIFLEGLIMNNSLRDFNLPDTIPFNPHPKPNVSPLLHTKWHQYSPYNKYCFTPDGQQAVAGCVAIAAAQICAYHRNPLSFNGHVYNWDAILANDEVSYLDTIAANSVGHLVHDIGVLVEMSYGIGESSADFMNVRYCWTNYGYSYNWDFTPTFTEVTTSLKNGNPVFISGTRFTESGDSIGHAWVIDGAKSFRVKETSNSIPVLHYVLRDFVHCNWGRGGLDDGYFVYGAFENKYDSSTMMINNGHYPYNYGIECYFGVATN